MDRNEYYRACMRMTEELAPTISPKYRGMVTTHDAAGAWDQAVTTLVGALSEEDVPVTEAQKETLRRIYEYLGQPMNYLNEIRIRL
ncbi:hypothetical protein [Phytomonospora endophytica]|uniref:Uncharacterized protein n=1 Tax=Phytomonospora endophytica TaxID=714109 RepID=A0A841FU55_9ACTN|nr:hypothetical protein [Phytomonospora endophytica]MBB6036059.1 hypothetical protein [Phytomonospora endophytica]GIG66964.1 hypothetical protein Pen01_32590 [Phytomonospora endophytica]